jgi:hypothetical protein
MPDIVESEPDGDKEMQGEESDENENQGSIQVPDELKEFEVKEPYKFEIQRSSAVT